MGGAGLGSRVFSLGGDATSTTARNTCAGKAPDNTGPGVEVE